VKHYTSLHLPKLANYLVVLPVAKIASDVIGLVTGFYTRKFLAVGNRLTIAGQSGILTAVTPTDTHTVLNSERHEILVANGTFLEQTSTQRLNLAE
jgi:hypothetical protein